MMISDNTKTFFKCFAVVLCLLATIIVAASVWNTPTAGIIDVCAIITLASSIVHVVKFTKEFTKEDRRDDSIT